MPILFLVVSACSTIPWNTVEGLEDGKDFVRLPPIASKPAPQVFTAIEGESAPITESLADRELESGNLLLEIRMGGCAPCDALEKTLTDEKAEEIAGARWIRLEVQGDSETARVRAGVAPTLVLLQNGVERARLLGNRKASEVRRFLKENSFRR